FPTRRSSDLLFLKLDLDTLRSTLFYCALSIILCFNSRFIGFTSISLDFCYIHRTAYTNIPLTYTYNIRSLLSRIYTPFISPSSHWPHRNRLYQNFALLDHSVYSIIGCWCGCVLTT